MRHSILVFLQTLLVQKRILGRSLKYQLNCKAMNHALSNQNNHLQAPKPESHLLSSREVGKAMVFSNSRQSGGLESVIYNSLHLKDSPTAEYRETSRVLN